MVQFRQYLIALLDLVVETEVNLPFYSPASKITEVFIMHDFAMSSQNCNVGGLLLLTSITRNHFNMILALAFY